MQQGVMSSVDLAKIEVQHQEKMIGCTLDVVNEYVPLKLIEWPDEILRATCFALEVARPDYARIERFQPGQVESFIDLRKVRELLIDLAKRYVVSDGCIGLAAPQAGMLLRAFVCHVPKHQVHVTKPGVKCWTDDWEFYINPTIIQVKDKKLRPAFERCLSQPGRMVLVPRPEQVVMQYQDIDGEWKSQEGFGLLARCWQHEIDHTRGINIGVKS